MKAGDILMYRTTRVRFVEMTTDGLARIDRNGESWQVLASELKPVPKRRNVRDQVYRDLGMVKVRGALGGVYHE